LREQAGLSSCCQQEQATSLFMRSRGNSDARLGLFFSQRCLAAQAMSSSHPVQLADTHGETESLRHEALDLAACDIRLALAVIQQKGEHLPAQLDGVSVSSLDQGTLAFALHPTRAVGRPSFDASGRGLEPVPRELMLPASSA
jgi:hypothetical protein